MSPVNNIDELGRELKVWIPKILKDVDNIYNSAQKSMNNFYYDDQKFTESLLKENSYDTQRAQALQTNFKIKKSLFENVAGKVDQGGFIGIVMSDLPLLNKMLSDAQIQTDKWDSYTTSVLKKWIDHLSEMQVAKFSTTTYSLPLEKLHLNKFSNNAKDELTKLYLKNNDAATTFVNSLLSEKSIDQLVSLLKAEADKSTDNNIAQSYQKFANTIEGYKHDIERIKNEQETARVREKFNNKDKVAFNKIDKVQDLPKLILAELQKVLIPKDSIIQKLKTSVPNEILEMVKYFQAFSNKDNVLKVLAEQNLRMEYLYKIINYDPIKAKNFNEVEKIQYINELLQHAPPNSALLISESMKSIKALEDLLKEIDGSEHGIPVSNIIQKLISNSDLFTPSNIAAFKALPVGGSSYFDEVAEALVSLQSADKGNTKDLFNKVFVKLTDLYSMIDFSKVEAVKINEFIKNPASGDKGEAAQNLKLLFEKLPSLNGDTISKLNNFNQELSSELNIAIMKHLDGTSINVDGEMIVTNGAFFENFLYDHLRKELFTSKEFSNDDFFSSSVLKEYFLLQALQDSGVISQYEMNLTQTNNIDAIENLNQYKKLLQDSTSNLQTAKEEEFWKAVKTSVSLADKIGVTSDSADKNLFSEVQKFLMPKVLERMSEYYLPNSHMIIDDLSKRNDKAVEAYKKYEDIVQTKNYQLISKEIKRVFEKDPIKFEAFKIGLKSPGFNLDTLIESLRDTNFNRQLLNNEIFKYLKFSPETLQNALNKSGENSIDLDVELLKGAVGYYGNTENNLQFEQYIGYSLSPHDKEILLKYITLVENHNEFVKSILGLKGDINGNIFNSIKDINQVKTNILTKDYKTIEKDVVDYFGENDLFQVGTEKSFMDNFFKLFSSAGGDIISQSNNNVVIAKESVASIVQEVMAGLEVNLLHNLIDFERNEISKLKQKSIPKAELKAYDLTNNFKTQIFDNWEKNNKIELSYDFNKEFRAVHEVELIGDQNLVRNDRLREFSGNFVGKDISAKFNKKMESLLFGKYNAKMALDKVAADKNIEAKYLFIFADGKLIDEKPIIMKNLQQAGKSVDEVIEILLDKYAKQYKTTLNPEKLVEGKMIYILKSPVSKDELDTELDNIINKATNNPPKTFDAKSFTESHQDNVLFMAAEQIKIVAEYLKNVVLGTSNNEKIKEDEVLRKNMEQSKGFKDSKLSSVTVEHMPLLDGEQSLSPLNKMTIDMGLKNLYSIFDEFEINVHKDILDKFITDLYPKLGVEMNSEEIWSLLKCENDAELSNFVDNLKTSHYSEILNSEAESIDNLFNLDQDYSHNEL